MVAACEECYRGEILGAGTVTEQMDNVSELQVEKTPVPGLLVLRLPVHEDSRGWFKESWQRAKMTAAGLPDFGPVQNNMSFNTTRGTTRGVHAEPWDKYVSVASGKAFGAWVDLREGPTFGTVFSTTIDPTVAVFVPRGVGNAFQTLTDSTAYSYLVNDHWSAEATGEYTFLSLDDPTVAVPWPIPLDSPEVAMSDKDRGNPSLDDVIPMSPRKILVLGANGQVGRALKKHADTHSRNDLEFLTRAECDLRDEHCFEGIRWSGYRAVINAAAFTAVDGAETDEGRSRAWTINAAAMARLARVTSENGVTVLGFSSDYVFDGETEVHTEEEPLSPLGVYGQSKAAGDVALQSVPRHYIVRTSWVIGDGANFVRTMKNLCDRGVRPDVVADQVGRLSFAEDLAGVALHLLDEEASYGVYNVSNSGEPVSWADIAAEVFERTGGKRDAVRPVTTSQYFEGRNDTAPRPTHSTFDLSKIRATGFKPVDWRRRLEEYLRV